jgi:bifunctional non-homologous end joining protein LigD
MIDTAIVGGWTEPRGSRPFFGSLLVGVADEQGELRYVGRVASGFTDAQLGAIWKQLRPLKTKSVPFPVVPDTIERAHWVKPKLAVRVHFSGWTKDGRLRRPVFAGLESPTSARSGREAARQTSLLVQTATRSAEAGKDARCERAHKERHSVAAGATRGD